MTTDALRHIPLFTGLSQPDTDAFLKAGTLRKLKQGAHLFHHGDDVKHFYLISQGAVQLFRETPDGHEKTSGLAGKHQSIGEGEIMDGCKRYRSNARAVEDSVVLEFPSHCLKDTAKSNGAFALNLLSMIAEHAHEAELEAEHQATMSAAQLVACFLQRLCILHDYKPEGFDLPYSKTLIASRLGMELETFSRTLGKLKDHGILVKGNHVSIYNLDSISSYVCDFCSISRDCATHARLRERMI